MKYSAKFYLEKRKEIVENVPVMLSVTFASKQMFYYTGKRCHFNQWGAEDANKTKQSKGDQDQLKRNQTAPNGQSSVNFNADLTYIKWIVNELFKAYDVASVAPTIIQLRDDLKIKLGKEVKVKDAETFFSRFETYAKDPELSKSSQKSYLSVINKIKKHDLGMTYENVNLKELKRFLGEKLAENTVSYYLQILKIFFTYALKMKYTAANPFESFEFEGVKYGRPIYINIEERDLLYNAVFTKKSFSSVRDIFVLQSLTGCRCGDLLRLTHSNIVGGSLQYIAQKTKKKKAMTITVPLSEKAKTIIARHNLPDGKLLPKYCLTRIDFLIKEVFREVGLTRIVTVPDKQTGLDMQVPICDIASSHMARRVFIGSLHKKGVKNEIIASMSGHSKDSKAFARYYDIDKEDQEKAMALIE